MSSQEFPIELWLFVAVHLSFSDLLALRLSSKRMYSVLKRIQSHRIGIKDISSLTHLQQRIEEMGEEFMRANACKISAASLLPNYSDVPTPSARSLFDLIASAPQLYHLTLSLIPFSDISGISIASFQDGLPVSTSLTHLAILNFRVLPLGFLAAFPNLTEVTITMVVQPEDEWIGHVQYRPQDVYGIVSHVPDKNKIENFIMTVSFVTPELVQRITEKLKGLKKLALMWYPEQDIAHHGVQITDCSTNLTDYIDALIPVRSTLKSLHLPICFGRQAPLNLTDDELGSGSVLSITTSLAVSQVRVSQIDTLLACEGFAKGTEKSGTFDALERVGWLIPQGAQGLGLENTPIPHLLVDCIRKRPEPVATPIEEEGESGDSGAESSDPETLLRKSFSRLATGYAHSPRSFRRSALPTNHHTRTAPSRHEPADPVDALAAAFKDFCPKELATKLSGPVSIVEPTEVKPDVWELSMEWRDGYAWPSCQMEEVFPLGVHVM